MTSAPPPDKRPPRPSASRNKLERIKRAGQDDVEALKGRLMQRFWLRFHMTLMLAGTVGTGALANKGLLAAGLHSMTLRWLVSLAIAYAAFFVFVRIWLAYVGARPLTAGRLGRAVGEVVDGATSGSGSGSWGGGSSGGPEIFAGGGGSSGGGGASAGFLSDAGEGAGRLVSGATDGAGKVFSGIGDGAGKLFSGLGDLGGDDSGGCLLAILAILVIAVLAAIGGGVAMLILSAPHLLADAAFSAMLAGGLVKSVHRMDDPDWTGSVLRATWIPLTIVAVLTLAAGLFAGHAAPGAHTLGEAIQRLGS